MFYGITLAYQHTLPAGQVKAGQYIISTKTICWIHINTTSTNLCTSRCNTNKTQQNINIFLTVKPLQTGTTSSKILCFQGGYSFRESRVSLNRANLLSCLWINLCIVCGFSTLLISLHARDAIARIISSRRKGNLVFIAYCKRKIICLFFQTSFHWERKISYSRQLFFNASHSF